MTNLCLITFILTKQKRNYQLKNGFLMGVISVRIPSWKLMRNCHKAVSHRLLSTKITPIKLSQINQN